MLDWQIDDIKPKDREKSSINSYVIVKLTNGEKVWSESRSNTVTNDF